MESILTSVRPAAVADFVQPTLSELHVPMESRNIRATVPADCNWAAYVFDRLNRLGQPGSAPSRETVLKTIVLLGEIMPRVAVIPSVVLAPDDGVSLVWRRMGTRLTLTVDPEDPPVIRGVHNEEALEESLQSEQARRRFTEIISEVTQRLQRARQEASGRDD